MYTYRESQWKTFRRSVIELDGNECRQCGRKEGEVILQVHHCVYKAELMAWEYPTSDCITLCKGCHAQIHGIIQPTFGWELNAEEDLGDLIGTCENNGCGASIRYCFTIFHANWGTLQVGTVCCDHLTGTEIASNFKESKIKFDSRQFRFINSKRWKYDGSHKIKQSLFVIEIFENENQFSLNINGYKSNIKHKTVEYAKIKVFEIIENGELIKFFKDNNIDLNPKKKNKYF